MTVQKFLFFSISTALQAMFPSMCWISTQPSPARFTRKRWQQSLLFLSVPGWLPIGTMTQKPFKAPVESLRQHFWLNAHFNYKIPAIITVIQSAYQGTVQVVRKPADFITADTSFLPFQIFAAKRRAVTRISGLADSFLEHPDQLLIEFDCVFRIRTFFVLAKELLPQAFQGNRLFLLSIHLMKQYKSPSRAGETNRCWRR